MTRYVLNYFEKTPHHQGESYDEWATESLGYFFVSRREYKRFRTEDRGSMRLKGALYSFEQKKLERNKRLSGLRLRKAHQYVTRELDIPEETDIRAWLEEHGVEYDHERFSHLYEDSVIPQSAIEFFEEHLYDDFHTVEMLEELDLAEDRHRAWGLRDLMYGAMFLRALEICDVDCAEELPFELNEATRNVINGSKGKQYMEEHCDGIEEREAAAALNLYDRQHRGKSSYQWTYDEIEEGLIWDDFCTLMNVRSY